MYSENDKKIIRREISYKTKSLTPLQLKQHAIALFRHFSKRPEFLNSHTMAFYWPKDTEIDPRPLMELALSLGKKCYLPVLSPGGSNTLLFVEYENQTLIPNRYRILEPELNPKKMIRPEALSLVLVPLIAYDRRGRRLGRGGGYYDQTFAFLKGSQDSLPQPPTQKGFALRPGRPCLIGLAHACQEVPTLPADSWDIPLSGIGTEVVFHEIQYNERVDYVF